MRTTGFAREEDGNTIVSRKNLTGSSLETFSSFVELLDARDADQVEGAHKF
jgi:hypothetical protein